LVHEVMRVGNTVHVEKLCYKGWQKRYGKSVGLRAPGMLIDHLRRTGAAHGRHPDRTPHTHDQTVPVLSRLRTMRQKAACAKASSLRLWHRASAARSLCGVSGRLSRYSRRYPLVCPVHATLGRCGGAVRTHPRECVLAPHPRECELSFAQHRFSRNAPPPTLVSERGGSGIP
jgi:hypothetical protein